MIRDHFDLLDIWLATIKAIKNAPAELDPRILPAAELCTRTQAFTLMPEGPENALALIAMAESFREFRGDDISVDEIRQIEHAQTLSSIVIGRQQRIAA